MNKFRDNVDGSFSDRKNMKFSKEDVKKLQKNVRNNLIVPFIVIGVIVFVFLQFTFTVNEMEQALVIRFGSIERAIVKENAKLIKEQVDKSGKLSGLTVKTGKGLMFKIPFVDKVEKYTSQLVTYKTHPGEVTAKDKKKIVLDNNAQWKIINPALFKITMKTIVQGNARIDDLIFSSLREKIGQIEGSRLISDKDFVYQMTDEIKNEINELVVEYGMQVVDVRIAKTEFPQQNNENIFNRMRTEREKIANKLRAEGDEQYLIITAKAQKEASILKAKAYEKAMKIRGEGDAKAAEIYAKAYSVDPEFYSFFKSLQTYKHGFKKGSKFVVSPNHEFFKYLLNYK